MLFAMHNIIYVLNANVKTKSCENKAKIVNLPYNYADFDTKYVINANEKLPLREVFHFLGKEY